MKASIDVDIGGTFTDCYVAVDSRNIFTKAPTTGYNLSVGFMKALKEASAILELSLGDLLKETEIIKYSTTIAMNTLIQRSGPKLGLITTQGFENTVVIGKAGRWEDGLSLHEARNMARVTKPEPPIPREMTVGARERVDSTGKILMPLDEEDMLEKVQYLVDNGARGFVVSLLWSFANPDHEKRIKEIIESEYPDMYLGNTPIMLSSEVCPKAHEYTRSVTVMLNAYLHQSMWEELSGMGDELRDYGYKKPLMMVHNTGGMAEVFRTSAVQTYNGGPVAGLIGGAYIGKLMGFDNVVVSDMGGTSFDLGCIVAGSTRFYQFRPIIDRWWVDVTMLETSSIGAGGGSIAWLNHAMGNRLEVGPRSAGSMPGPAAYDLGGSEPTVTDADIILGYVNPEYYHGGKMTLSKETAIRIMKEKIAEPAGIEVEEAALLTKKIVDGNMGDVIAKETFLRGYDPKDFILFACGGAGPTHCCGYGFYARIPKLVIFPYSPVFCAFGSSNMDVVHLYEKSTRLQLLAPVTMAPSLDFDVFKKVVEELREKALRDIRGEGFSDESTLLSLELDMKYGGQIHAHRIISPMLIAQSEEDISKINQEFEKEYSLAYSPLACYPQGGVEIHNFVLRVTVPQPRYEIPSHPVKGEIPSKGSFKGTRDAYWEEFNGFHSTPVYEEKMLGCGNIIEGPAIIEAENTTTVLPPGTSISVDKYLNLVIEKM